MPVFLDAIPDVAPGIPRPVTRRWLYLLAAIMALGNVLTFWLWTRERSGLAFWFMASGLPFCLWGLLFTLRRFSYKCDQVWAASWNRERQELLAKETARGQRTARVLLTGVKTQSGSGTGKLLNAVKSSASQLDMQVPRTGALPVRHSRLAEFADERQSQDLDVEITNIVGQLKPVLAKIPADVACWMIVDCDIPALPKADEQIRQAVVTQTERPFRLLNTKGFVALDFWLDELWQQPALLLAVSVQIRPSPQDNEGEAITWTLLVNRDHSDFPDAVKLHRPEKGSAATLTHTLGRALLWSNLAIEEVKGACTTGSEVDRVGDWSRACEENGTAFSMTEYNHDVDQTTGYTGRAAPWLAVSLAVSIARQGSAQVVVAETCPGEIWVAGITPAGKTGINQDLS